MRWLALALMLLTLDGKTTSPEEVASVSGEPVFAFTRTIIRTPPHPEPPPEIPPPVVNA